MNTFGLFFLALITSIGLDIYLSRGWVTLAILGGVFRLIDIVVQRCTTKVEPVDPRRLAARRARGQA